MDLLSGFKEDEQCTKCLEPNNIKIAELGTEAHMNDACTISFDKNKDIEGAEKVDIEIILKIASDNECTDKVTDSESKVSNTYFWSISCDNGEIDNTSDSADKGNNEIVVSILSDKEGTNKESESEEKVNKIILPIASNIECVDKRVENASLEADAYCVLSNSSEIDEENINNVTVQIENNTRDLSLSLTGNRVNLNQEAGNDKKRELLASEIDFCLTKSEDLKLCASYNSLTKDLVRKEAQEILELSWFENENSKQPFKRQTSLNCEVIEVENGTKENEAISKDLIADVIVKIDKDNENSKQPFNRQTSLNCEIIEVEDETKENETITKDNPAEVIVEIDIVNENSKQPFKRQTSLNCEVIDVENKTKENKTISKDILADVIVNIEENEKSKQQFKRQTSSNCEVIDIENETKENETISKDISADVIAEIDKEIEKSLISAFFGKAGSSKMKAGNNFTSNVTGFIDGSPTANHIYVYQSTNSDNQRKEVGKYKNIQRNIKYNHLSQHKDQGVSELMKLDIHAKHDNIAKPLFANKTLLSKLQQPFIREPNGALCKTDASVNSSKPEDTIRNIDKFKTSDKKRKLSEDDVVWICFVCAKEFSSQSELMTHQNACEESLDDPETDGTYLRSCDLMPSETLQNSQNKHFSSSSITNINETNNSQTLPFPAVLRKVGSDLKVLPLGLPDRPRIFQLRKRKFDDVYIPPPRDVYFEALGLFPTQIVEQIYLSPSKNISEDDCQIIDLTDDIQNEVPSISLTPRSKSILFHPSTNRNDCSSRKRRLTYAQDGGTNDEDSDESDSSDSSKDYSGRRGKVPSKSAILGIPLTSPLGQRLKKHWHYDVNVPIIEDLEQFCKNDDMHIENEMRKIKNKMTEKLRNRPPAQVTFKFTKRYLNRWCHLYKFNYTDRHEFQKILATGLDCESRIKLKRMKPCKVVLYKISKTDILYWTTTRTKPVFKSTPNPNMKQKYIDKAKTGPNQFSWYSGGTQSQVPFSHLPKNVLFQQLGPVQYPNYVLQGSRPTNFLENFGLNPTPQLFVHSVSSGNYGMTQGVLPLQQTSHIKSLYAAQSLQYQSNTAVAAGISRNQKRKKTFDNVRQDDDIVICLSSDDDEEPVSLASSCSMCHINKEQCSVHRANHKLGPASFMKRLELKNKQQTQNTSSLKQHAHRSIIPKCHMTSNLHQMQYASTSTASSIVFSSYKPVVSFGGGSLQSKEDMSHVKIVQGKPILLNSMDIVPQNPPNMLMLSLGQTSTAYAEVLSVDQSEPSASHNRLDDGIDFEVICIDSDNDV